VGEAGTSHSYGPPRRWAYSRDHRAGPRWTVRVKDSERRHDVEHAIQHGRVGSIEDAFANDVQCPEEDFGLLAGLRVAVPLGLAIWAVLIWAVVRFIL
jgi:hypothetical protein